VGCVVRRCHPVLTPTCAPTESSVSLLVLPNMQRQYGFGNDDKCVSGGDAANENHHYLILFRLSFRALDSEEGAKWLVIRLDAQ